MRAKKVAKRAEIGPSRRRTTRGRSAGKRSSRWRRASRGTSPPETSPSTRSPSCTSWRAARRSPATRRAQGQAPMPARRWVGDDHCCARRRRSDARCRARCRRRARFRVSARRPARVPSPPEPLGALRGRSFRTAIVALRRLGPISARFATFFARMRRAPHRNVQRVHRTSACRSRGCAK